MASAVMVGCTSKEKANVTALGEIPTDRMTYRVNPKTGEKVSILGYGCMRWPTVGGESARDGDDSIDQEAVNRLVDYAIAHGVNYLQRPFRTCYGDCFEASSKGEVFYSYETLEFRSRNMEPGGIFGDVS